MTTVCTEHTRRNADTHTDTHRNADADTHT